MIRENVRGARTLTNAYLCERKIAQQLELPPAKPMDKPILTVFGIVAAIILGVTFWPVFKPLLSDFVLGFLVGAFSTVIVLIGLICVGVMVGVQRISEQENDLKGATHDL